MKITRGVAALILVILMITPIYLEGISSEEGISLTPSTSSYSSSHDTIYVFGGGNSLSSIYTDVGDETVFYYDIPNRTGYCYANLTVQGWLNITDETLYFDNEKTFQINSTGGVNITRSEIAGKPEEKRWWEGENRYNIHKNESGTLYVGGSHIMDTGWGNNVGERGIEIYGTGIDIVNTTLSSGLNGLVFYAAGDITDQYLNNITFKNFDSTGILLSSGTNFVNITNSTFYDNWEYDASVTSSGNLTLMNCTIDDWEITSGGRIKKGYYHDFLVKNGSDILENHEVKIFPKENGSERTYWTDDIGRLHEIPFIWKTNGSTYSQKNIFGITADNKTTYFSPSSYNFISLNTSTTERIYLTNVTTDPTSFVPINNSMDPQNITLSVSVTSNLTQNYQGNVTFYYSEIPIARKSISVSPDASEKISVDWIPEVEGYDKIRAEIDPVRSITNDNLKAWSDVFFAGYYNETIVPYKNKTEKCLQMMEWGVKNEDADGYYTIYEDWLPDILMEMGLAYYGAHARTGNESYLERGEKQFDYALSFRDEWGLYNFSTVYEVKGLFEDTYEEWNTHRNVRAALALQDAYFYTHNETYLNAFDTVIDFILNKVAMDNITYHGGINYTVPWTSTEPNNGSGGIKGVNKDHPFVYVNGYSKLGRLFTQAYFDENLNSSYYHDDRLLPHMRTCIRYIINDQIYTGDSKGTWAYFSYLDEPDPWRRRSMKYGALAAKELARTNTYLNWDNISKTIDNYTDYVEQHLTIRSAIDTHNGGSATITTYNSWSSLYNTTGRNVSKIDNIKYSNIFFNDDGTFNWFQIDTDRLTNDPEVIGFLYVHYNPFRSFLWDRYYEARRSLTHNITLGSSGASEGWNFISTNLVPKDKSIESILNAPERGIEGSYDKVMYYDSTDGEWKTFAAGRSSHYNDLNTWDHTMGIWIHMTKNDTLTIQGHHPYRTKIELEPGWNMVGYPSESNKIASDTLPSEITKLGVYNEWAPYNLEYIQDLSTEVLVKGRAYWVYNGADDPVDWSVDY